jgi:hypothetical protein
MLFFLFQPCLLAKLGEKEYQLLSPKTDVGKHTKLQCTPDPSQTLKTEATPSGGFIKPLNGIKNKNTYSSLNACSYTKQIRNLFVSSLIFSDSPQ